MKNRNQRFVSLAVSLFILLGILSGCAQGPERAAHSEGPSAVEPTDIQPPAPHVEDPSSQPETSSETVLEESLVEIQPAPERISYSLPLYEDIKSFTFWSMYNTFDGSRMEFPFWNQLAEATGVNVEFVEVNIDVCNEKYNLMIASGDYTDVIWEKSVSMDGSAAYPGGYEKAIDDGCTWILQE